MVNTNSHPLYGAIIMRFCCKVNLHSPAVFYTIFWGSMFPDFSMFFMFFYYIFQGETFDKIFDDYYYRPQWSLVKDYLHSIPLSMLFGIICYAIDYYLNKHHKTNIHKNKINKKPKISALTNLSNDYGTNNLNIINTNKNNNQSTLGSDIAIEKLASVSVGSGASSVGIASPNVGDNNNNMITSGNTSDEDGNENINGVRIDIGIGNDSIMTNEDEGDDIDDKCEAMLIREQSLHSDIKYEATCRTCWFTTDELFICLSYWFISMMIHAIIDFPVHAEDSHAEFRPFTSWTFNSPISYWDPKHYGNITGPIFSLSDLLITFWVYRYKRIDWMNDTKCVRITWKTLLIINSLIFVATLFFSILNVFD